MQQTGLSSSLILPEWPAPVSIVAAVTTRHGGCSIAPFDTFNLADHVADDPAAVAENRRRLQGWLGPDLHPVQWLNQVHGTHVVRSSGGGMLETGDAVVIDKPGYVGAVLTADCLPVLFASTRGDKAAVAHAGWRGLAGGILERTLEVMAIPANDIVAWLGPAIAACHFEVGKEVRDAFVDGNDLAEQKAVEAAFRNSAISGKYYADLYELARLKLASAGVNAVYGGGLCTVCDSSRFYSYRRDGNSGRMATLIGLKTLPHATT